MKRSFCVQQWSTESRDHWALRVEADTLAVDAGEVGLTADAGAEAGVEGVVPDVEFPDRWRVAHGEEVDSGDRPSIGARDLVGDIDDVLVGADAVETGDLLVG